MNAEQAHHADGRRLSTNDNQCSYTDDMTDVGSPVHGRTAVEDIANGIARRWQDEADTSVRMLTPTAVYLHERKLVEWVFESTKTAADYADTFKQIRKRGIDVGIVLPMPELGRAHEEFWERA
jgi:hypothetical protein